MPLVPLALGVTRRRCPSPPHGLGRRPLIRDVLKLAFGGITREDGKNANERSVVFGQEAESTDGGGGVVQLEADAEAEGASRRSVSKECLHRNADIKQRLESH